MKNRPLFLSCIAVALGATFPACGGAEGPAVGVEDTGVARLPVTSADRSILVPGNQSQSIEWFDTEGAWLGTFASTGAFGPEGIAQSPVTGDLYVTTLTRTVLRYRQNGQTGADWDTLTIPQQGYFSAGVLFDEAGNLYVSTAYGTAGWEQDIYKYTAQSLALPDPSPSDTIATGLRRGDQLAFDQSGNLCIASFIDETVSCFNPTTHVRTFDYNAEIISTYWAGNSQVIEPIGLAFDETNRLYLPSVFTGEVFAEPASHTAPMARLASGLKSGPTDNLGFPTLDKGSLYVPSLRYPFPPPGSGSDIIYKIDTQTGVVTPFITSHLSSPYQMIFARVGDQASPSCQDGLQNQGETGVDCGGPCAPCPGTPVWDCIGGCWEQEAACGDVAGAVVTNCLTPCPTNACVSACEAAYYASTAQCAAAVPACVAVCYGSCSDGVQDDGEAGVDCGGPCPRACGPG